MPKDPSDTIPATPPRKTRKRALPRGLRKLHERLRVLPAPAALDLVAAATVGQTIPEARLAALRLRIRLIGDALDKAPSKPARAARMRPKPVPAPEPEPIALPEPKPAPAPRPKAATLNTLDPSDPSIFGMLSALGEPDEPTPATTAAAAPPVDAFSLLDELDDAEPGKRDDALFEDWPAIDGDATAPKDG